MSGNYGEEREAQASVIQARHWSREEAERAVGLALLVVRAGARDSLGWWEDEALTEAGAFALRRIFPRDPRRVAVRLAFRAARERHSGVLASAGVGLLDSFRQRFQELHGSPWEKRRKVGRAVNEASAVLHHLDPRTYPHADSWARSLGQGRADVTPNLLAERTFELAARRKPGQALMFVVDEVGQYISRSVDKMLDLQAVVQAFGVAGKNRVKAKKAISPCWVVATSQEKLDEVVTALDSKKVELARRT
jgi:hypothetical protein